MSESAQVAVCAVSLTAEEVAACYRRGIPFTDLVILIHPDGTTFGRIMDDVTDAHKSGASIVWLLDHDYNVISIFPSWTHLSVVRGDAELAMPELPLFRCRVRDFYRLLGLLPETLS